MRNYRLNPGLDRIQLSRIQLKPGFSSFITALVSMNSYASGPNQKQKWWSGQFQKIFYYVLVSVCAFIFLHVNSYALKLRFNPSLGANHTKLKDVSNFSLKPATDIRISPNSMIIAMLLYLGPTNSSFCFRKYTYAIIQNATVQMLSDLQQILQLPQLVYQLIIIFRFGQPVPIYKLKYKQNHHFLRENL
ncbi:Hypothetical_protein [Hexamita inflata]|uniref:Hypothetical_protein n=1 Tax=Hexamita inflata TaxID=28002 RepID=A0AA86V3W7_9EUKA|nr:Hypothetical protein HINF_LOCUS63106 [Hexamita inflata]